jgi:cellulose synthase/poly-beta-1,6-N-acetylglucosamine synthase-like glycosyltransferase
VSPPLYEAGAAVLPLPVRASAPAPRELGRAPGRAAVEAAAPSARMYLAVFAAWALTLVWFHPRLAALVETAETRTGWLALAFFVGFTYVAWLYAFFNVGVIGFAVLHRRAARREAVAAALPPLEEQPVALLYTTCNDFVEKSALSCVEQDYGRFTVYLLDDSSDPMHRARVDRFAAEHPERVKVVRRRDRRGFKAGNLNHALAHATLREPFFALVDADEILPRDFVAKLAPRLAADPSCGFIQAGHRHNPDSPGALSRALGPGIDSHWRWYQPLRNRYGFVMLLGHGALIRREAWEAVGGFPELVSEDLAFALRVREKGWRGRFAEDVVCLEDFPEDMRAFRVRHMKWTRGTCEFLAKELRRVLFSRHIPLVEKLDVLFPTLNLPLSLLYFLFILDANVLLVSLFGERHPVTLVLAGRELVVPMFTVDARFTPIMTADFYAVALVAIVAPVLCFVLDMWRTPLRLLRFLGQSTAAYGTLGPLSSLGVVLYALTGKAVFHVTADRSGGAAALRVAGTSGSSAWARLRAGAGKLLAGSHPDHRAVQAFEVAVGIGFALVSLATFQVAFLGLSLGFILLPVMHHLRWETPLLRPFVYVPFVFVAAGVALGGLSLLGLQTVLFGYGFHF